MTLETNETPDLDFLRTVPVLGGLEDAELERVWSYAEVHRHGADETVLHEGDLAKEMFVVLEGEVEIVSGADALVLGNLKRGDCFGEMALIDIQPRSASVRTLAPTTLLVIGFDDLIRIYQFNMQTYTIVVLNIAREISRRLRKANTLLAAAGVLQHTGP